MEFLKINVNNKDYDFDIDLNLSEVCDLKKEINDNYEKENNKNMLQRLSLIPLMAFLINMAIFLGNTSITYLFISLIFLFLAVLLIVLSEFCFEIKDYTIIKKALELEKWADNIDISKIVKFDILSKRLISISKHKEVNLAYSVDNIPVKYHKANLISIEGNIKENDQYVLTLYLPLELYEK